MRSAEMWKASDVVPTLTYTNLSAAIEWLQRVLGFSERANARIVWPGGGMAWFDVGDSLINISTPDQTLPPGSHVTGGRLKVYVGDIDRHFAHARAEGANILSEPEDRFWGGRIYRVMDPENHIWEISQQGRDLSVDRWQLPPGVALGVPTP